MGEVFYDMMMYLSIQSYKSIFDVIKLFSVKF